MQDVVSSRGRPRELERQNLQNVEGALEREARPRASEARRWPGIISIIAIVFSGISLYQSVIKQAELAVHVGEIVQYARDPVADVEILAIPTSIANHGARDATVTGLDLTVDGGGKSQIYRASFVGSDHGKEGEPFAPWPIAGRGSHTAIVRFHASEPQAGDGHALITGPGTYHFCLSIRADTSREFGVLDRILQSSPNQVSFTAALAWFSSSDLAIGKSIPMRVHDITTIETRHAGSPGHGGCKTGA